MTEHDWQKLLSTTEGRKLVSWLIWDRAQVDGRIYSQNPCDTAFNEGRRSIGVELAAAIQHHVPKRYTDMVRERMETLEKAKDRKNGSSNEYE